VKSTSRWALELDKKKSGSARLAHGRTGAGQKEKRRFALFELEVKIFGENYFA
jgi:hypothetical protein